MRISAPPDRYAAALDELALMAVQASDPDHFILLRAAMRRIIAQDLKGSGGMPGVRGTIPDHAAAAADDLLRAARARCSVATGRGQGGQVDDAHPEADRLGQPRPHPGEPITPDPRAAARLGTEET
ncbi:hypothetical protein Aph01nite_81400 [Acrocarpospora phusangensis]|uniref:Uncharacterized protein n=1 Tax=Acrocarpospora phusangensis TaxID=1070424 RepID=A0A919QP55_9ACTN|nr:hypothetical protein [Acrocarpospora phusangensis]GIH29830.1 hypothetical protein Aph01nite_81400 [Acrocarpospora phusangensis]